MNPHLVLSQLALAALSASLAGLLINFAALPLFAATVVLLLLAIMATDYRAARHYAATPIATACTRERLRLAA